DEPPLGGIFFKSSSALRRLRSIRWCRAFSSAAVNRGRTAGGGEALLPGGRLGGGAGDGAGGGTGDVAAPPGPVGRGLDKFRGGSAGAGCTTGAGSCSGGIASGGIGCGGGRRSAVCGVEIDSDVAIGIGAAATGIGWPVLLQAGARAM